MNLKGLEKFIPPNSMHFIEKWLKDESILIRALPARKTKLGDYKFLRNQNRHQITMDGTLDPIAFFFVLTHEIAHLHVYNQFKGKVSPHGEEWKQAFGKLLIESLDVYPNDFKPFIHRHAFNPKASVGADKQLQRKMFMNEEDLNKMVERLREGQKFRLGNRIFERGEKRKIRYLCKEVKSNRYFLVKGQAVVDEIISE